MNTAVKASQFSDSHPQRDMPRKVWLFCKSTQDMEGVVPGAVYLGAEHQSCACASVDCSWLQRPVR